MPRPYILITNDDGVHAAGIQFLTNVLLDMADVLVVAPDGPRSGAGCSISPRNPLVHKPVTQSETLEVFSCTGTPVDCVKLALNCLCRRRPDLVCAGINHGDNSSCNAHYSGTLGAATEGALQGFPSVAFSSCGEGRNIDFEPCEPIIRQVVRQLLRDGLPQRTLLNVNFPDRPEIQGLRFCRMASARWEKEIETFRHPLGYKYHWLVGQRTCLEPDATDTDIYALARGFASAVPMTLDQTDYALLARMLDREMTN